jgi:hypothetical protein
MAIVGVMATVAACGSVRAGPGGHAGMGGAGSVGSPSASAGSLSGSAGSPSASAGGVVAGAVPLCANAARLDRMVVGLGAGFLPVHVREAQPRVTIADPARVRAMAAALCRLPVRVPVHTLCPSVHSPVYRLTFFAAGRTFPPVTVEAVGCQLVASGLGPVRLASGPVLDLLRRDLGHSHRVGSVPLAD